MIYPTYQLFQHYQNEYTWIPIGKKVSVDQNLLHLMIEELILTEEFVSLLESGRVGQYSYLCSFPLYRLTYQNSYFSIINLQDQEKQQIITSDPLGELRNWLAQHRAPKLIEAPDFQGGGIGFFSYDLVRCWEDIRNTSLDDLKLPLMDLIFYRDVWIFDHKSSELHAITYINQNESYDEAQIRLNKLLDKILSFRNEKNIEINKEVVTNDENRQASYSKEEFGNAVKRVQEYISAGDVFQVNLSIRQNKSLKTSPFKVYESLREVNPSPYMGYLHYPQYQIVSGSPELLIKVKGKEISTRPIAGTRPRGENREEDLRLAKELIDNPKERAEHIMLVDLERNDLGRVSKYGSVKVTELMTIEKYSHVMHIVSHVVGELREDEDAISSIKATFPGGTITGAPKIRTMQIIEELEPVRRGIYTGSIGWIGYDGDMELNIAIRTLS